METVTLGENPRSEMRQRRSDIALLVLRVMIGVVFIAHGAQKLFGAFGGSGLDKTAGAMAGLGLEPGMFFAVLGGLTEFGGGLLLLVGLCTPLAGLAVTAVMVLAIALSTGANGFISMSALGYEYNLVLIAIALALVIAGPGRFSLDHRLGLRRMVTGRTRAASA